MAAEAAAGAGAMAGPAPAKLARRGSGLRQQGLFPLRFETLSSAVKSGLSPTDVKRLSRDAAEAFRALNSMHGEIRRPRVVTGGGIARVEKIAAATQQRVENCALAAIRNCSAMTPEGGIGSLLKHRSPYGSVKSTSTAPFDESRVSFAEGRALRAHFDGVLRAQ